MIIISPYAKHLKNGDLNPKNYPYWEELISMIKEPIIQVGVSGEKQLVDDCRFDLTLTELESLVHTCRTWIAVDSFYQHFCWDIGVYGIVLWGPSDPLIFGHHENINLIKSRDYLLERQFFFWDQATFNSSNWISPETVVKYL